MASDRTGPTGQQGGTPSRRMGFYGGHVTLKWGDIFWIEMGRDIIFTRESFEGWPFLSLSVDVL